MIYSVHIAIVLILAKIVSSDYTLEDQNQQQELVDPVNQPDSEYLARDPGKRTIFPSTINSYAWAKHLSLSPSGAKYVLGYGPVSLKYVPVIKPFSIKPTYQFRPVKGKYFPRPIVLKPVLPAVQVQKPQSNQWKPIYGPPVVPVNVPAPPHSTKPWQKQGWSQQILQVPIRPPVSFVPNRPAHSVINLQPAPVVPRPVVPVTVLRPVQPLAPVRPVQPLIPAPPFRPVFPAQPVVPVTQLKPVFQFPQPAAFPSTGFVHTPLLQFAKSTLPVLPLGASFSSPVLNASPQAAPAIPNVFNFPVPVPHFHPQPLPRPTVVEFHGNHFGRHPWPFIPPAPVPVNPQGSLLPSPYFPVSNGGVQFSPPAQVPFQHQLPRDNPNVAIEQHDVQAPVVPQTHQHIYQEGFQPSYHQFGEIHQQPAGEHQHRNQQQLQYHQAFDQDYQQQFGGQQIQPHPHHQQLQYQQAYQQTEEGNAQNQFVDQMQQFNLQTNQNVHQQFQQQQEGHRGIQPGQTDLQLPLHLPSHPHFSSSGVGADSFPQSSFQQFQTSANIFRPSIGLEPPFQQRREDKNVEDVDAKSKISNRKQESEEELEERKKKEKKISAKKRES